MYAPITADSVNALKTQLSNAPIVVREQTEEQKTNCLRELLEKSRTRNINTMEGLQQLFERQKATRRAYISVLDPDGPFTKAYAQLYQSAIGPGISYLAALLEVQSYVINRRDEQVAMLKQLENPKFFQEVVQALSTGYTPPPKTEGITEQKKKVLVDELVQLNGLAKREPAIHIGMTARGHEPGHWALAKALDPNGPLASVLAGLLAPQATHLTPEEINKNAHDYLAHFQKLAVQVAEALTENGQIVAEAVRQSEESRQKSGIVVMLNQSANDNRHTSAISPRAQAAIKTWNSWETALLQSSADTQQSNSR